MFACLLSCVKCRPRQSLYTWRGDGVRIKITMTGSSKLRRYHSAPFSSFILPGRVLSALLFCCFCFYRVCCLTFSLLIFGALPIFRPLCVSLRISNHFPILLLCSTNTTAMRIRRGCMYSSYVRRKNKHIMTSVCSPEQYFSFRNVRSRILLKMYPLIPRLFLGVG